MAASWHVQPETPWSGSGMSNLGDHWQRFHTREETNAVAFSPDGKVLAVGTGHYERGDVTVWDVSTYEELTTLSGDTGGIASVAFSPDGAILASGGSDRIVRLWDVASWQEIDTLVGHTLPSFQGNILARWWSPRITRIMGPCQIVEHERQEVVDHIW